MSEAPEGWKRVPGTFLIRENSDLSESHVLPGQKSPLARDRTTGELSQVVILDEDEPDDEYDEPEPWLTCDERGSGAAQEDAPDISALVPWALVAAAGVVIGVRAVQKSREKRRSADTAHTTAGRVGGVPAGWYEIPGAPGRLRYWTGLAWTDDYAQRAVSAPRIEADWYPDPSNAAQVRYWNGTSWTHHVAQAPGTVTAPADWYPDPASPAHLRYWDGRSWTDHVSSGRASGVTAHQGRTLPVGSGHVVASPEPKISMTSAEWKSHVEAWLHAGVVHQELWHRLSHAYIEDADAATLEAQRRMEALSPDEGARRITLLLEANPGLRQRASLIDLTRLLGNIGGEPLVVERNVGPYNHR
ncbi:DUF2510 domain-containing protein [Flavimobilis sp. GY10621]|uniref:DUF2510 domain-containing protein n=1 Tax=Flavimobilis rhizosphaerae TaxID=2775421 RepID=A0ABR9DRH7_9MICO|nr:DUF2510 domain-containing protein [Flavimobilis rhizosphaerae]MBD9699727.1 DUF2510 domain-containing protein [Flavimobilis rhizosphaerae]